MPAPAEHSPRYRKSYRYDLKTGRRSNVWRVTCSCGGLDATIIAGKRRAAEQAFSAHRKTAASHTIDTKGLT